MSAISHIVLVGWKADAPADIAEQASALVEEIAATVPGIESVVEGPSISTEELEGPFSWGLTIGFEGAEALEVYATHPAHLPLIATLSVFDIARD